MKITKIFAAALAACLLTLAFASCASSSGMSEDEIRDTYRTLVEASYELNDIYYGAGLPYDTNIDVMSALTGMDAAALRVSYMPVSAEAAYQKEADIRAATKKVFSDEISSHLFTLAFSGISVGEDVEETVAYARYIEQDGVLTVRLALSDEALPMGRTYDFDAMTVLQNEENRIRASFPSTIDGKKSVDVKITLVKTADGWRLDSPTY